MTDQLTIVAKITANEGHESTVEAELHKLIEPTRQEVGCVQYVLHRSLEDPRVFLFFENWESKPQWDDHMGSAHLQAFLKATDGMLAGLDLLQMEQIG
jgi:quinol monooxygenase YgiN